MKKMRFLMPLFFLAAIAIISSIIMLLWNFLMPAIFGLIAINFWQALGLLVLARLLFGGFGRGGMKDKLFCDRAKKTHRKWDNMTDAQRKEFIDRRRRFGFGHAFGGEHFDAMQDCDWQRDEDK